MRLPSVARPVDQALSELRGLVEFEHTDAYTRLDPDRNSLVVVRVLSAGGSLRAEVFYDEAAGLYRAMPENGSFFGSVSTRSTGKVLNFLHDELWG